MEEREEQKPKKLVKRNTWDCFLSFKSRDAAVEVDVSTKHALELLSNRESEAMLEPRSIADLSASWLSLNLPTEEILAVMNLANGVFGDAEIAEEWLCEPNLATDSKPPIGLLGTEDGFLRVKTLLQRIEYGVLA